MESATLTRPRTGPAWLARLLAVPAELWAKLVFAGMCVVAAAGFLAYPTYPVYDSYYALLWGRELVHGQHLSFQAYRAPTEHPLSVAFSAVLSLVGKHADRLLVAATIVSFLVLAAGLYRLSRISFSPLVGAVAVVLLLTRFSFAFLAVRGYVDIPYLAAVVWAAALEAEHPRRGGFGVFGLLFAAELMRPEAWLLGGLYWLWYARRRPLRQTLPWLAVVIAGPLIWAGLDLAVTGDPLFSFHSTNDLAVTLGRNLALSGVPGALGNYLVRLDKTPVLIGAGAGAILALVLMPRRIWVPLAVMLVGLLTFVAIGAGGLSVIDRYLLVPALMGMVFCAFALGGWSALEPGGLFRRVWILAAALLALYGIAVSASTLSISNALTELGFRGDSHNALAVILAKPKVRDGLRCGPLSVPNHKLVPEARWILGRGPGGVIARSDARAEAAAGHRALLGRMQHGVALYPTGLAVQREALVAADDNPLDQVPLAGFVRVAHTQYYGAFARC
jgi:hypothetical protein